MERQIENIIFLNTVAEAEHHLGRGPVAPGVLLIAMRPKVFSYLKQNGIDASDTTQYFTNESHEKVLKRSKEIVDWLRNTATFTDLGLGVKYAYKDAFIYWARLALHYCLWSSEVVTAAIESHKPKRVSGACSGSVDAFSLLMEPEEHHLGYIVKSAAEAHGLDFSDISQGLRHGSSYRPEIFIAIAKFTISYCIFAAWQLFRRILSLFRKGRVVYFTSPYYQMDKFIEQFKDKVQDAPVCLLKNPYIPFFRISDPLIRLFVPGYASMIIDEKKIMEDLACRISKEKALFSHNGISFAGILSDKISRTICNYPVGLMLWTPRLESFIGSANARAFISNGTGSADIVLAELCGRRKIPAIMISHGSHVSPKNEYEEIEWGEHGTVMARARFSHIALQSPLAERYYKTFPTAGKFVRTGPLVWGRAIDKEKGAQFFEQMFGDRYDRKKMKVVVHAGTPKRAKGARFYVYETIDEYLRALSEIAKAVERLPDTILVIKFRPSAEINEDDIKSLVGFSDRIKLSTIEPLADVLGTADLLMSFSSTTIEEALQNRIPVLLYGGGGRYKHVPAYDIRRDIAVKPSAVYHVSKADDLEYALRNILDLNIKDDRHAELFGSYRYSQEDKIPVAHLLQNL